MTLHGDILQYQAYYINDPSFSEGAQHPTVIGIFRIENSGIWKQKITQRQMETNNGLSELRNRHEYVSEWHLLFTFAWKIEDLTIQKVKKIEK